MAKKKIKESKIFQILKEAESGLLSKNYQESMELRVRMQRYKWIKKL